VSQNASTDFFDKSIDRSAMIRLYERRVSEKISVLHDEHEERLDKLIRSSDFSIKKKDSAFADIQKETLSTYQGAYNLSKRSLLELAQDQISFTVQNFSAILGKIWNPERPSLAVAENIVLEQPLYKNMTLESGWSALSLNDRKQIEAVIRKGIADGLTVDEIAVNVRKFNVHSISRNQSKALVVTAVTSVTAQADYSVYRANGAALRGWQYVAVLDARTTPVCAARDGHTYPLDDRTHLPPAHFRCRSTSVPVFKSWEDLAKLENVANIRKRNLENLTEKQKAYYDGLTPLRESYDTWLRRQSKEVQMRHLGDYRKFELFNSGQLTVDKFVNDEGNSLGINELRAATSYTSPGDTTRFSMAKSRLDAMQLGYGYIEDLYADKRALSKLSDYYLLQAGELDGTLSLTNYRGVTLGTKSQTKKRVLSRPPTEDQLKFNPITGRYEDVRVYQPNIGVYNSAKRRLEDSGLLARDIEFINALDSNLEGKMSLNERSTVLENLRILFERQRKSGDAWGNFKAVTQSQLKFDIMNISDSIETHLRKDTDVLKKLLDSNYIDPVLGSTQLQDLHDTFLSTIKAKNNWEDKVAPKIARELRGIFDTTIAKESPVIWKRLDDRKLQQFYLKFANRLSLGDSPDRDQLAAQLGRDLYNLANLNGYRKQWYNLGLAILDADSTKKFYEVETFGVQKRRMKSRLSGAYFGPYYDTLAYNIRIIDPRLQAYSKLSRKVEVGLRVGVTVDKNRLVFREGYKTYFIDEGLTGFYDTRIPITSTSSFSDFPEEFVDKNMTDALNWASKSKYRIDKDYYDFVKKLLYFEDDKGQAKHFNELNEYKKFISSRGDAYERFKAMEWLREKDTAFSNHPFIDHRARIYDRGLISPQSGETFRPFLNTEFEKSFSKDDFLNFQDQIGAFLGGASDKLEGRFNSLTITGRQKIAKRWRNEMVKIGNHMLRRKPGDIRAILESELNAEIDGEELGKFYRFAIESAKIDKHLNGVYTEASLKTLSSFKTGLALEQDASSSGAQIIALTTRNKQLAELSNVVPTNQKRRLYDEIAAATFTDPEFKKLNVKLGLTEKDLRKAAKAQNMVTFYGAGERTGIMNVEGKLSKVLGKQGNTLVVKAADRDTVLNEISAQIAKYEKFDLETAEELRVLRQNVKDIFNKGLQPGDDIMEQLWFLDSKTKDLVEKMSSQYERVVTPDDFKAIASIMSGHLREKVPILKDFTRFFGRLAEDYLTNAKPSTAAFDWGTVAKTAILSKSEKGYTLPDWLSELLGTRSGQPISEKLLSRFGFWKPDGTLSELIYGVASPEFRRTGAKFFKVEVKLPTIDIKNAALGKEVTVVPAVEVFYANKMPKSWTNVPWVNFDGKVVEQNFTQSFEERLVYKNPDGTWTTNILQIPQKTEATWWDQIANNDGKINDIADATKARTAFAVNGNHSNDAVIVKKFHLWGKSNGVATSTIHDAFFANAADMLRARSALRSIYAETLDKNIIEETLLEMKKRGLPPTLYDQYRQEAIDIGLIPIVGKSKIGGKLVTEKDILRTSDILKVVPDGFKVDYGWYGVG